MPNPFHKAKWVLLFFLLLPLIAYSQSDVKKFTFQTDSSSGTGEEEDILGYALLSITLVGSTGANREIAFEVADDIGTFTPIKCTNVDTLVQSTIAIAQSVVPQRWQCPIGGFTKFRTPIIGGSTGTINVKGVGLTKVSPTAKRTTDGPGGGGEPSDADKGDITVTASGTQWNIDPGAVTFTEMQTIAGQRILGRDDVATGVVEELDATAVKTLLSLQNVNNTSDTTKSVASAQALANDPIACLTSPQRVVVDIAANGTLSCQQIAFSDLSGVASDAQIPNLSTLSTGLTPGECMQVTGGGFPGTSGAPCGAMGSGVDVQGIPTAGAAVEWVDSNTLKAAPTTGIGNYVLSDNPILSNPDLGTPSFIVLQNASGLPFSAVTGVGTDAQIPDLSTLSTGLPVGQCMQVDGAGKPTTTGAPCSTATGTIDAIGPPIAGRAAQWVDSNTLEAIPVVGTGSYVRNNSPSLINADLGTPSAIVLTSASGMPATGIVGTLPTATGGTGVSSAPDDNVLVGNGSIWQSKLIPPCADVNGQHLNYDNEWLCGTTTSPAKQDVVTWGDGLAITGTTARTASQEPLFLNDGAATPLVCGAANQGKMQVMDNGELQYCDGSAVSQLKSGIPTQTGLTWAVTPSTCTSDGNNGKLTVLGTNQIVCSSDQGGLGGGGDIQMVGNCPTGNCLDGTATGGSIVALYDGNSNKGTLQTTDLTADRTYTLPNESGSLVCDTCTQTITGKSISGATNTFTSLPEVAFTFIDVTTGNATVSAHGFLPKLSGISSQALRGTGVWAPVGDASTNTSTSVVNELAVFSDATGKLLGRAVGTGIPKLNSGVLAIADPGTDYVIPSGNVATANALATNPLNCTNATDLAAGISATGVAEGCIDVATQIELNDHTSVTAAHGATSANTPDRIVLRDPSGSFAAGTITATLSGNATSATQFSTNPPNCTNATDLASGISATGAAEGCTDVATQLELNSALTAKQDAVTWGDGLTIAGTIASTASQEPRFIADGGTTPLVCGLTNQGKMQVMDNGDLQYCDGASTSLLQTAVQTNTNVSVNNEVVLFSGTTGKVLKRAIENGIAELTNGVLGVATQGVDYVIPSGNVATATALASNPANCANATDLAAGISNTGVAEGCLDVATQVELDAHAALTAPHGATSANTPSSLVLRDPSGNFIAGTITATLSGNATSATQLSVNPANCTSATDLAAGVSATGVAEGCIDVATQVELNSHTAGTAVHGATSANTPSTIVLRDASGNFVAGTITGALSGNASSATQLSVNPANCTNATDLAAGISNTGVAEGCVDVATQNELNAALPTKQDVITWDAGLTITGTIASTNSQEALFLRDGGTTSLTCGSANQGKMQVMDNGEIQYCDGATTSLLKSGPLTQTGLTWNVTPGTCTGDPNAGKLTVNGTNQVICAADQGAGLPSNVADGDKGDISITTGQWNIDNNTVTLADIQDINSTTILGRITGAVGDPEQLTPAQARTVMNVLPDPGVDGLVVRSGAGAALARSIVATDTDIVVTNPTGVAGNIGIDVGANIVKTNVANAWADTFKQTFNPDATVAGINVGSHTADPSTLANGDFWYNSTSNQLKTQINGVTTVLGAAAGVTDTDKTDISVTGGGTIWTIDSTFLTKAVEFTNKKITPRVWEQVNPSSLTIDTDIYDAVHVSALAQPLTFPVPGATLNARRNNQQLEITIFSAAVQTLTFTTGLNGFANEYGAALPTQTKAGVWVKYGFIWNATTSRWGFAYSTQLTEIMYRNLPITGIKTPLTGGIATPDRGESWDRLLFDGASNECALWQFIMPGDYAASPSLKINYSMLENNAASTVHFNITMRAVTPGDAGDIAAKAFAAANTCNDSVAPTAQGVTDTIACALTNNDNVVAGDTVQIQMCSSTGTDTANGDREILGVELSYRR